MWVMFLKKMSFRVQTVVSVIEQLTGSFTLIMSNLKKLNRWISTILILYSKNRMNATIVRKLSLKLTFSTKICKMNLKLRRTKRFVYKFLSFSKITTSKLLILPEISLVLKKIVRISNYLIESWANAMNTIYITKFGTQAMKSAKNCFWS